MKIQWVRALLSVAAGAAVLWATGPGRLSAQTISTTGPAAEQSAEQRDSRMAWWRDARFGMFIHWGIYAIPAQGEWYMNTGIPRDKYAEYARQFNPVKFDADRWARIAHDAGMKYLVITSKHHDGFCMFRTKATDYNVVEATPWHHDPLADLSRACRRHGVRFGVYYSIMDWHSPDQAPSKPDPEHPTYNPTHFLPGKKDDYVRYMKTQFAELIHQYHPAVLWFDGGWMDGWTDQDGQDLYRYLRSLDPALIINNRERGAGDYETPEQQIPATGLPGHDWETCMTINNNWGFNAGDDHWKSNERLIHNLIDIASKGGNYLLNVGPTAEGVIPAPEVERLTAMGRWLKQNGPAIYGASASPFPHLDWGRCTRKGSTLYLNVFDWPANGTLPVPLKNSVTRAYLLAQPRQSLRVTHDGGHVQIQVPAAAPDPIASVIALQIQGAPEIETAQVSSALQKGLR